MDLTEIPRRMPQFGRSMRNLLRPREEVFSPRKVGFKRGSETRCCGGAGADSLSGGSCGCGGREARHREFVPYDIFGEQWDGGNGRPWLGNQKPTEDGPGLLLQAQWGICCADIYCRPIQGYEFLLHCYFLLTDCSGVTWLLELDPNHLTMAWKNRKEGAPMSSVDMIMLHRDFTPPAEHVHIGGKCQTCGYNEQGVLSCPYIDCLSREAVKYPYGNALTQDFPLPTDPPNATPESLSDQGENYTAYKKTGPNSNTFIAYLARRCHLPPLKEFADRRLPAPGAGFIDRDLFEDYLENRLDWLRGRK